MKTEKLQKGILSERQDVAAVTTAKASSNNSNEESKFHYKEERKRIENMLDYPSEYTSEEFRMALDHVLERCTKAEAFIRGFHDYFLRMKGIWKRWLPIVRKSFVVSK